MQPRQKNINYVQRYKQNICLQDHPKLCNACETPDAVIHTEQEKDRKGYRTPIRQRA